MKIFISFQKEGIKFTHAYGLMMVVFFIVTFFFPVYGLIFVTMIIAVTFYSCSCSHHGIPENKFESIDRVNNSIAMSKTSRRLADFIQGSTNSLKTISFWTPLFTTPKRAIHSPLMLGRMSPVNTPSCPVGSRLALAAICIPGISILKRRYMFVTSTPLPITKSITEMYTGLVSVLSDGWELSIVTCRLSSLAIWIFASAPII